MVHSPDVDAPPEPPPAASRAIGLGCMRLSAPTVQEARAVAVVHAALDAGVTLLDTADVYAPHDGAIGHNERLIARALAAWPGDRSRIRIASKGGLTRPGGRWVADGRARHLAAAAQASCAALGVGAIDLYQLHAVDPRTPLATSVRALADLRAAGLIRAIGLCNVNLAQLVEASRITDIAAVQVELSMWSVDALHGGLVEHCRERGIELLCHTPLGGDRWSRGARERSLDAVAARRGASPAEVALAWLCDLSPGVVPLPGATRPENAASAAAGQRLALDDDDRRALDELAPAGRIARVPRAARRAPPGGDADVVLVMGSPAAGKSTWVGGLVADGYRRLNRDLTGGTLAELAAALERGLAGGERRFVLDNTYPSRAARNRVIEAAWRQRAEVRCVWLDTSLEDAQVNAAHRILAGHDRLLGPDEIKRIGRRDPSVLPPSALFTYQRLFEPPGDDEGFAGIQVVRFERAADPARTGRAVIVELDGDLALPPAVIDSLAGWRAEGWLLLATAWHPASAAAEVERRLAELRERHGLADAVYCSHGGGPPVCWCRKPLPGLGALLVHRHHLDPAGCHFVGSSAADRLFAARLGFQWSEAGPGR
jgi:aryl-alcohol dehydrogenase-like predicted oxidoreductase